MLKNKGLIWILSLPLLLPFFLGHSGYCSSYGGWYSKREVVGRFLFGSKYKRTTEQKIDYAIENGLGDYPNNCRIINATSNGFFLLYSVDCIKPRTKERDTPDLYEYNMYKIDGCGKSLDFKGYTINGKKSYEIQIERNKQYWEDY